MSQAVTIREQILEALALAGAHGLSMAALGGVVRGPWRAGDVEAIVRKLWELNQLGRRPDGTFVATEKAPDRSAPTPRARRARSRMDAAVARVAAQGRREGHSSKIRERTVDPALLRAFCPGCRKTVAPRLDGTCAGCGTQTGANLETQRPRRHYRRKPLEKGQPGWGPLCPRCGGAKGKQARTCRSCRTKLRVGRKIAGGEKRRGPKNMSEEQLHEARRLYATGLSLRQVTARLYPATTYASEHAMHESLYSLFKTRGWKLRPQREVTRARNFKHGRKVRGRTLEQERAYRRWLMAQRGWNAIQGPGRPLCKGVKRQHPGKGRPCAHHALEDSEYCHSHDPRRELERQAHLARMRATGRYREPLLDGGPFAAWLSGLCAELGGWREVAARIGAHQSAAHRWGTGRTRRVAVRVIARSAKNAGTTLEAIYGEPPAEQVAA